jgi:hypothetical protein
VNVQILLVLGQAVSFPQVFDIHIATQVKMEFDGALRQNRAASTTLKAKPQELLHDRTF